jgi:DNA excision repair protein ERCC-2
MPTAAGKTTCVLALILAFIKQAAPSRKLIYCTRTVGQLNKATEELKLINLQPDFKDSLFALSLSIKSSLCLVDSVRSDP